MFSQNDLDRLREAFRDSSLRLDLTLHGCDERSSVGAELLSAARSLEAATDGSVRVRPGDGQGVPATPAMGVGLGNRQNVRYLAVPSGREAGPFVEMLSAWAESGDRKGGRWPDRPDPPACAVRPVEIVVFIAQQCPVCPQAVRAALRLALSDPAVTVTVVDAAEFPGLAGRFNVRSVPTTVLDGGMTVTGVESFERLSERVRSRHTEAYRAEAFRSMVEAGRFADAAGRIGRGEVRFFVDGWRRSTTATRIALMLTAEAVLGEDPPGLDEAVKDLVAFLASEDTPFKGDTVDLLGRIAHVDAAHAIRGLLDDPDPDVAEAAREALKAIESRSRSR